MRLIDIVNTILVGAIFAGFSMAMLWSLSRYDHKAVKQGIIQTVNGAGSNFTTRPYSHNFGNTVKAR